MIGRRPQDGIIHKVSERRGWFIVQFVRGDFAAFEVIQLRAEFEVGDHVRVDPKALGRTELENVTRDCRLRVFGQTGPSSLNACLRTMGN